MANGKRCTNKGLQAIDDGLFDIGLRVAGLFTEAEEFEHERLLQHVFGPDHDLTFPGELADARFVATERETLVKAGGLLALQLRHGPTGVRGFDLVEAAFVRIFDGEEDDVAAPAQGKRAAGFPNRLLGNRELVRRRLTFFEMDQLPNRLLGNLDDYRIANRVLANLRGSYPIFASTACSNSESTVSPAKRASRSFT